MPLSIGEGGSLEWQRLARVNEHPRDLRIQFNEEEHSYAIDGVKTGWSSCTQFLHNFFGHFDPDEVIAKMMKNPAKWRESKYYGMTPEEIKAKWAASGEEASTAGTRMHLDIEYFYNSSHFEELWLAKKKAGTLAIAPADFDKSVAAMKKDDNWEPKLSPEWTMFQNYQEKIGSKMIPFRTEWLVFNERIKVAGSIDMLYMKKDGTYAIYDWKRSKEIKTENRYQSGLGPVMHLPDTNYWHYSLQLNVYRMILKEKYDMDVNELALVILHPNNPTFQVIKVNIMEEEINAMFDTRLRALQKPGNDGTNPIVLFDDEEMDLEELPAAAASAWLGSD
jgi:hypothetical protein